MFIHVCPLPAIERTLASGAATHLLSVMGPRDMIDPWPGMERQRHLRVVVNDIVEPGEGLVMAQASHIEQIVEFTTGWAATAAATATGGEQNLLIHCWAGISRSTAAAYIALCALNKNASESQAAETLRAAAPFARPNMRLVGLADTVLGRRGRMASAIEALGDGQWQATGQPFRLPAILEAS